MWQQQVKQTALGIRRVFEHHATSRGLPQSSLLCCGFSRNDVFKNSTVRSKHSAPSIPLPFAGPPKCPQSIVLYGAGYHGAKSPEFDRFFVSPAHYALVIYAALVKQDAWQSGD
ncbi:MAG: hypothetical protein R3E08_14735 [Thiotrichaceae bacterium]